MNLTTIQKRLQPDIIGSFWTMLQELRSKADSDDDLVLKTQVEGWYRQWNTMTGDNKRVEWSGQPAERIMPQLPECVLEARANVEQTMRVLVFAQLGLIDGAIISPNTTFVGDLGADSLDLVELVMALEDEFYLDISDNEAEKCMTFQQAVDHIKLLIAQGNVNLAHAL